MALNRLWVSENPDARFGSMDATDLGPYVAAIDQAIQQVAAISRTPPSLLLGKITNLSAEALKSTESGLVQKTRNRMLPAGECWEQAVRLSLRLLGDPRSELVDIETIWRDPENVSEAQRVDALVKLNAIGLPARAVWERYGATPQEIRRWEAMQMDDVFRRMMLAQADAPPQLQSGPAQQDQQDQQDQQEADDQPDQQQ